MKYSKRVAIKLFGKFLVLLFVFLAGSPKSLSENSAAVTCGSALRPILVYSAMEQVSKTEAFKQLQEDTRDCQEKNPLIAKNFPKSKLLSLKVQGQGSALEQWILFDQKLDCPMNLSANGPTDPSEHYYFTKARAECFTLKNAEERLKEIEYNERGLKPVLFKSTAILEALIRPLEMNDIEIEKLAGETTKECRSRADQGVKVWTDFKKGAADRGRKYLDNLEEFGLTAVLDAIPPESPIERRWLAAYLVETEVRLAARIAQKIDLLMIDKTPIPKNRSGFSEGSDTVSRVCDEAFLMARKHANRGSSERHEIEFSDRFLAKSFVVRDKEITKFRSDLSWKKMVGQGRPNRD